MANRNYYANASSFTNANILDMEAEQHEMKLRQMGGEFPTNASILIS